MSAARRPSPRYRLMAAREHRRLWRMVEGAVLDAFHSHTDYLTEAGREGAVGSITKRVVGQLVGYAKQARVGGRPVGGSSGAGAQSAAARAGGDCYASRTRFPTLLALLTGEADG